MSFHSGSLLKKSPIVDVEFWPDDEYGEVIMTIKFADGYEWHGLLVTIGM